MCRGLEAGESSAWEPGGGRSPRKGRRNRDSVWGSRESPKGVSYRVIIRFALPKGHRLECGKMPEKKQAEGGRPLRSLCGALEESSQWSGQVQRPREGWQGHRRWWSWKQGRDRGHPGPSLTMAWWWPSPADRSRGREGEREGAWREDREGDKDSESL